MHMRIKSFFGISALLSVLSILVLTTGNVWTLASYWLFGQTEDDEYKKGEINCLYFNMFQRGKFKIKITDDTGEQKALYPVRKVLFSIFRISIYSTFLCSILFFLCEYWRVHKFKKAQNTLRDFIKTASSSLGHENPTVEDIPHILESFITNTSTQIKTA